MQSQIEAEVGRQEFLTNLGYCLQVTGDRSTQNPEADSLASEAILNDSGSMPVLIQCRVTETGVQVQLCFEET